MNPTVAAMFKAADVHARVLTEPQTELHYQLVLNTTS